MISNKSKEMTQVASTNSSRAIVFGYDPEYRVKIKSLLHTRNLFVKFPSTHILSKVSQNSKEDRVLLIKSIFSQSVGVSSRVLPGWGPAVKSIIEQHLIPHVAKLIDKHRQMNYKAALMSAFHKKNLPYPSSDDENPVNIEIVLSFISEVLQNLLPGEMVGNNSRGIQRLARSMVRGHQPLTMKQMMHYVSQNLDKGWLANIPSSHLRNHVAAKLTMWIAAELIPGIIRSALFGTRKASGNSHPLYYTKSSWQSQSRKALNQIVNSGYMIKLPQENYPDNRLEPGVLRLMPKANGLRPIVVRKIKNDELANRMKKAKLFMKKINPPALNINEAWGKFRSVVINAREVGEDGHILFVKTDVKSAFVTVKQEKVLQVLDTHVAKMSAQVQVEQARNPWLERRLGQIPASQSSQSSQESASGSSQGSQSLRPRLIAVSRDAAYKTLRQEIEQQVLRHGTRRYKLKVGLAQGSPLSNNLCNMTFNDLYNRYLAEFNTDDGRSVLWRVADDFLLLTLSETTASRFKDKISVGFEEYGWQMSTEKTVDNIGKHTTATMVKFNGGIFDLVTLEAMGDLSHYTAENVFFNMSFRNILPTTEDLYLKQLLSIGSLKLERLYLNMSSISRERILEQISASGKLQALRFRALTRYLLGEEGKKDCRALFIANCVWRTSNRITTRILKLLQASSIPGTTLVPSANEIKWLLNMAIYKRSSGYLGKAREMIKNNLLKLENQIGPLLMVHCYTAHNTTRDWDAK